MPARSASTPHLAHWARQVAVTTLCVAVLTMAGCGAGTGPITTTTDEPGKSAVQLVLPGENLSRGGLNLREEPGTARPNRYDPSYDNLDDGADTDPRSSGSSGAATAGVDAAPENRTPGAATWLISERPSGTRIEGYADATSVLAGQSLRLFVSSTAATFTVQVLRTGDYGGRLARLVWTSPPVRGGAQTTTSTDPITRMITTGWRPTTTLATGTWPPGAYLAKLVGADGAQSYVPFVIRDARSTGAVLLINSVNTWQAYNSWGGPNTYRANVISDKEEDFDERAVAASFDRPYDKEFGAGGFIGGELPAIAAAERSGLRLNYATDVDLHLHPEVLDGAVGVAFLGHDEYWSRAMREVVTAARDRGTNLAFLGANDVHRRIRYESSPLGPARIMINYKLGDQDPVKTLDTTADWGRQPFAQPQSSLVGPMFRCAHARGDLVISDPEAWVFRGLGLTQGTTLTGVIGPEFDRVITAVATPRPLQVLSHSPVQCRGAADFADMTWYAAPSGAGVFAAGTLDWVRSIDSPDPLVRKVTTTVTERVLRMIGTPRAGLVEVPTDNVATYYAGDGSPLP